MMRRAAQLIRPSVSAFPKSRFVTHAGPHVSALHKTRTGQLARDSMKIKVTGKSYTVWLNGMEVMTYQSTTIADEGPIGIQLHPKNEMSISFRKIRLAEL
jgi:hypothetical protein